MIYRVTDIQRAALPSFLVLIPCSLYSISSDPSRPLRLFAYSTPMSPASTANTQGQSPPFDKISFIKYMKNIGRAYRKQATELVSICRTFVQAQDQAFDPDAYRSLRV